MKILNDFYIFYCLFISIFNILSTESLKIDDRCPDGRSQCAPLRNCPTVLSNLRKGIRPNVCQKNGADNIVCCPDTDLENNSGSIIFQKKTSKNSALKMCNTYILRACNGTLDFSRPKTGIVGGIPSKPRQFPHMTLIGYGTYRQVSWNCGGSLISEKFVLSAAHCSSTSMGDARWVRLGELDVDSKADDATPEDVEIIERFVHPEYKLGSVYNDIALFKLSKTVQFTDYIRPACLHTHSQIAKNKQEELIATGWGSTAYGEVGSSTLMYVNLHYINYEQCKRIHTPSSYLINGINENTMICAGYLPGGKDTCLGDSGGPLQYLHAEAGCPRIYKQVGITSFGKGCALANSAGLYTKISNYITWIEDIVWK